MKTLFLVTGSNGALGEAYAKELLRRSECVIAIVRGSHTHSWPHQYTLELLDKRRCEQFIRTLDFNEFSRVVLIHTVGKFHFELTPGVFHSEVWQSNVATFAHIADPLIKKAESQHIEVNLVAFGSPSDPYQVPFWSTFTAAKNAVREHMRKVVALHSRHKALFVSISSTRTANEEKLRPFADRSKWLTPEEVVSASIDDIVNSQNDGYHEIQVIRPDPNFNNYYADIDAIRKKWMYEMFGTEKEET